VTLAVTYRRQVSGCGGWWQARACQIETQGRTLAQTRRHVRMMLAQEIGAEAAERVEFVEDVRLSVAAQCALDAVRSARAELAAAEEREREAVAAGLEVLMGGARLGQRDVGELLGVSHQRVHQMRAAERPVTRSEARQKPQIGYAGSRGRRKPRDADRRLGRNT
jgi:hypothetical protein